MILSAPVSPLAKKPTERSIDVSHSHRKSAIERKSYQGKSTAGHGILALGIGAVDISKPRAQAQMDIGYMR
jgi:hypothetical protein